MQAPRIYSASRWYVVNAMMRSGRSATDSCTSWLWDELIHLEGPHTTPEIEELSLLLNGVVATRGSLNLTNSRASFEIGGSSPGRSGRWAGTSTTSKPPSPS